MKIISNKAKCLICGDIIESNHVHDYKTCGCGNLSVDGGLNYLKRSAKDINKWEDLSVVDDKTLEMKALEIIKYKKPIPQAKKLIEEAYEFAESVLNFVHGVGTREHMIAEFSDVSLMLKEFEQYYIINKKEVEEIMIYKADRTLNKIQEEKGGEVNMEKEKLELKLKHLEEEQFLIDLSDKWTEKMSNRNDEITKEIKEVRKQLEVIKKGEQNDKDNN